MIFLLKTQQNHYKPPPTPNTKKRHSDSKHKMQTFDLDKPEDVTTLRDLIKTDDILKRAYDAIKMLEYLTTRNIILGNKSGKEEAVAMQTLLDVEEEYSDSRGIPIGSSGNEPVYSAVVDLATRDTRQELENDPIVMECLIRKRHTLDRYLE